MQLKCQVRVPLVRCLDACQLLWHGPQNGDFIYSRSHAIPQSCYSAAAAPICFDLKHPAEVRHLTCVPFQSHRTYSLWTGSSFPQRMEPHLQNFMGMYRSFPRNLFLLCFCCVFYTFHCIFHLFLQIVVGESSSVCIDIGDPVISYSNNWCSNMHHETMAFSLTHR